MRTAVFSTHAYDRTFLAAACTPDHELVFLEARLNAATAPLAAGCEAACLFVNDQADAACLQILAQHGVRFLALRSAGYNHVDLAAARALGLRVARVPAYSPHAVAEHTLALILSLNRRIHRAYNRVRESNFALDGLLGFDLHGKTVGVIGTGQIGFIVARLLAAFGCEVLAHDPFPNPAAAAAGIRYVPLAELLEKSRIVTLHCPLTPENRHLVDAAALAQLPPGALLVNTSRGALLDTRAVIAALKSGHLGALALDVYEEEGPIFFEDRSGELLHDDIFARLLTFPNVLVTGHQAFFTQEALEEIARVTAANLNAAAGEVPGPNELQPH